MRERLVKVLWYLLDRLREPMTYVGLSKIIAAGSWAALDGSSRGEVIMQYTIIGVGVIEALLPNKWLYKRNEPSRP
jgi:hypothetical protein